MKTYNIYQYFPCVPKSGSGLICPRKKNKKLPEIWGSKGAPKTRDSQGAVNWSVPDRWWKTWPASFSGKRRWTCVLQRALPPIRPPELVQKQKWVSFGKPWSTKKDMANRLNLYCVRLTNCLLIIVWWNVSWVHWVDWFTLCFIGNHLFIIFL